MRNFYDGDGFSGGTYKLGKLTQRVGYNRILSPTATVTEQFTYSSPAGRLSQETTSTVNGTASHSATQSWTYDALGLVKTHGHPRSSGSFTVTNTRSFGYITVITAGAGPQHILNAATYNPSGGLSSWTAGNGPSGGNGVVTTITQDSSLLPRPSRIQTTGAIGTNFDSGLYHYDGAGNIVAMGNGDLFDYDLRSRLTGASYSGVGNQSFSYDRYGNLLSDGATTFCTGTCVNNKLPTPTYDYDTRGNLKKSGAENLYYDDLSRQVRDEVPGTSDWRYLYAGSGERAAKVPTAGGTTQYTYRDEGSRIVTEYYQPAGQAAFLARDNVFLGSQLVASFVSSSQAGSCATYPCWEWNHSDHLGTPRLVTDIGHTVIDSRKYWPYGSGIPGQPGTLQKLKFCTMERDSESSHYYDHARMHDAVVSRFLSPDKVGGKVEDPQTWNRYAYGRSNPLGYSDPDGLAPEWLEKVKSAVDQGYAALDLRVRGFFDTTPAPAADSELAREAGITDREAQQLTQPGAVLRQGANQQLGDVSANLAKEGATRLAFAAVAGAASGLRGATSGLFNLFAGGNVAERTIVGVRSELLRAGFTQTLSGTKEGFLFRNAAGEEVRIMRRGGEWLLRVRNRFGNYLDAAGNVSDPDLAHLIKIKSR